MKHHLAAGGAWEPANVQFVRRFPVGSHETRFSQFSAWLDRQRQRIHLSELDDHLLQDIGVSKSDAAREARKWS